MATPLDEMPEPANLRLLRRLVSALLIVMIVGFVLLIVLFIQRLGSVPSAPLPAQITLPDGTTPTAFTTGPTWYAVVTDDDRILIYDRAENNLMQTIIIGQ